MAGAGGLIDAVVGRRGRLVMGGRPNSSRPLTIDRRNSEVVRALVVQADDSQIVRLDDELVALPQKVLALAALQAGRMVVHEGALAHAVHIVLHRKTRYLVHERFGSDDGVAIAADRPASIGHQVVVGPAEQHSVLEEANDAVVEGVVEVVQFAEALVAAQAVHVPEFVVHVQDERVVDLLTTFETVPVREDSLRETVVKDED